MARIAAPQRLRQGVGGRTVLRTVRPLPLYVILIAGVGLPIGYLVYAALQTGAPTDSSSAFTWGNITALWRNPIFGTVLANTMELAALVTVFSLALGIALAWLVARTDLPGRRLWEILIPVPMFVSPFAGAIAWVILGSQGSGFLNVAGHAAFGFSQSTFNVVSLTGMVVVMVLFHAPYAYLFTVASLKNMDGAMEEASRLGGAGLLRTLVRVTLPMSLPGALSAALVIFVLAAEMFSVPAILGPGAHFLTLPYYIYQQTQFTPPAWGQAAAAGLLLLVIMAVGVGVQRRATRLGERFVTVTGKGLRPSTIRLGPWRWLAMLLPALYFIVAVLLPMGTLVTASFMRFVTAHFTRQDFTVGNWQQTWSDPSAVAGLKNSLIIGVVTPLITIAFAFSLAYLWQRLRAPLRRSTEIVAMLPIAVPSIVLGVGVLWAYVRSPVYGTIWVFIIAYAMRYLAHPVRIYSSTLVQIDKSLEEASRVAGAGQLRTVGRIVAPLLREATLSSWLVLFILMTGELNIAIMVYTSSSTVLPINMWGAIVSGEYNQASIIAVVQSLIVLIAFIIAARVFKVDLTRDRLQGET